MSVGGGMLNQNVSDPPMSLVHYFEEKSFTKYNYLCSVFNTDIAVSVVSGIILNSQSFH